jgi:tetratricopeptide (TPR) repeat protein
MPAVVITAEAGLGKTRLVTEFAQRAESVGWWVLVGHCSAVAAESLPFIALTEVLRSVPDAETPAGLRALLGDAFAHLARLLPELGPTGALPPAPAEAGPLNKLRFFDLVRQALTRVAASHPTVAVVEDMQWMARSGVELFDYLTRVRVPGLRLVGTCRTDDVAPSTPLWRLIAESSCDDRVIELKLAPLTRENVETLITQIRRQPVPSAVTDRIFDLSSGNPLFVEELASTHGWADGRPLPDRILNVFAPRLEGLPGAVRDILRVAAAGGRTVDHALLAAVTGLKAEMLDRLLRPLVERNLLCPTRDGLGYEFRHGLLLQAVHDELLPGERVRAHKAYAAELTARLDDGRRCEPYELAALARHCDLAGDPDAAVRWALAAASAAEAVYAFDEALEQYKRALRLLPHSTAPGIDEFTVLERATRAADLVGDLAACRRFVQDALAHIDAAVDPVRAGVLEERLAFYRFMTADNPPPTNCARALDLIPAEPPTIERARALATHSWLVTLFGNPVDAIDTAEQALAIARAIHADAALSRALVTLGVVRAMTGNVAEGQNLLRQGCELAVGTGDVEMIGPAHAWLGSIQLAWEADPSLALGTALVGHKTQRLWGIERHEGGRLLLIATQACGELGRWDEALDWAKLATSYGGVADQSAVALAGLISDCRGDVAELSPNIADSWPATWPTMAAKWYCEWLAERHLVVKRPDAAGAVVRDALYHLAGKPENIFSGRLLVLGLRAAADLAVRATDTGDDTEAVAAADQATELETHRQRIDPDPFDPSRSPVPTAAADTAGWAAERSRLEGHSDPAAWAMAAQAWVDICRPYPAAYALWRQAEALVADRQARRNAAPILRSAYRAALDLGSGPLVIEVRDLAGRTNVSLETNPQVSEDDAASPAHLVKLTPRERDVTRLLADGLTNHAIARTPCHQP